MSPTALAFIVLALGYEAGALQAQDFWYPTSRNGAPSGRGAHSAVWTGREMIIWGGFAQPSGWLNTGARYDPASNTWRAMSQVGAPSPREFHGAVWTGREMIVWGGRNSGFLSNGARYDPVQDSWTPVSSAGSPPGARSRFSTVWTGRYMIVWGGENLVGLLSNGARYDPVADSWSTLNPNAPTGPIIGASDQLLLWTGRHALLYGSTNDPGGVYDPNSDTWTHMSIVNQPFLASPAGVWTGRELLVFGEGAGNTPVGARYDPLADSWTPSTLPPEAFYPTSIAVWTGREALVLGTLGGTTRMIAGRYDPDADAWLPMNQFGLPPYRIFFTWVWTGQSAIVWGGMGGALVPFRDDGALYTPAPPIFVVAEAESGCLASAGTSRDASWLLAILIMVFLGLAFVPPRFGRRGAVVLAILAGTGLPAMALATSLPSSLSFPTCQQETPPPPSPPQEPLEAEEAPWLGRLSVAGGIWVNGLDFEATGLEGPLRIRSGAMATLGLGAELSLWEPLFARITAEVAAGKDVAIITPGLDLGIRSVLDPLDLAELELDFYAGGLLSELNVDQSALDHFDTGFGFRIGTAAHVLLAADWTLDASMEFRSLTFDWAGDPIIGDDSALARGVTATLGISYRF